MENKLIVVIAEGSEREAIRAKVIELLGMQVSDTLGTDPTEERRYCVCTNANQLPHEHGDIDFADYAKWLAERMRTATTSKTTWSDLMAHYEAWCESSKFTPEDTNPNHP